jgi:transcriptional regulator with XRE-family HTH domain
MLVRNRHKDRDEAQRIKRFGPPPINPFKRLRTQHGFTHRDLQDRVFISKQALIRLEQGTYDNPLPSVLEWWAEHTCNDPRCISNQSDLRPGEPIGELYLRDLYATFQQDQRARFVKCFGPTVEFNEAELARIHDERNHPFRVLRERCYWSVTETAKHLCLPQYTLEHFERKYRTQQSVPKLLRIVLKEVKYSSSDVRTLDAVYNEFRTNNRRVLSNA